MNRAPLSPISALVAHVEPLIENCRVLLVGSAGSTTAEHLLDRGARLVQVLDPDSKRVAQSAAHNVERRITFAQLTSSSLRDASFDVALVEDLQVAGSDVRGFLAGVKRSLGNSGVAIVCARNDESVSGLLGSSRGSLDFDTFSDALYDQFESVTLLGQSPFLGYSVVQFGLQHPPEPSLDNAFLKGESESPDYYIAICTNSDEDISLEDMTIVQLPAVRLISDSENSHREKEQRAARRVLNMEEELESLRRQVGGSDVDKLTIELELRDSWIRQLEQRAESADARADDAHAEVEELEQELEDTHAVLLNTRQDADRAVKERDKAVSDLKTAEREIARLGKALNEARDEAAEVVHQSAGREALEEELNTYDLKTRALEDALEQAGQNNKRFEKRLAAQDEELDELHRKLDETELFLRDAEDEIDLLSEKLEALRKKADKPAAPVKTVVQPSVEAEEDLKKMEAQLTERGRRVIELESQLRKLEAYARTLKAEISTPDWTEDAQKQADFEQLARSLAEREADLVAAEWTIGQLQRAEKA